MSFEYLLTGVESEEYATLKKEGKGLLDEAMSGFNDHWKPKTQNIKVGFKYNPDRSSIGIFLRRKKEEQLVLDSEGLTKAEDAVVGSLYNKLQERLARIRIPKEAWE